MRPFVTLTGTAAALPRHNIDTDVIMPKQFLKGIDRAGLADGVFFDLRHKASGELNPDFVLNQAPWKDAIFLVVGSNFGCGSSREHAVWGLSQLGVRALIGTSFAGIFFDNCARNGLLAVSLPKDDVEALLSAAATPATSTLTVDLPRQSVRVEATGAGFHFDIEERRKDNLVRGLDAVGWALEQAPRIRAFEAERFSCEPWLKTGA
jgi:3-isopropylmalate/(R)-2-methylmalate dehydratase small subunit